VSIRLAAPCSCVPVNSDVRPPHFTKAYGMMNDFIEAVKTRLNSPILGYFGLALVAFNWQAFFFLLVQQGDALARIQFFEQHTSTTSLVVWPLAFSLLYSAIYPWVLFLFTWLSAKPTELKDMLQVNSEHKVLVVRKRLEEARSNLLADTEKELIERAKRDQELEKLQSEELRQKLKSELEQLRAERDSAREGTRPPLMTPQSQHMELMELAATYRAKCEDSTISSIERHKFSERARELEERAYEALMQSDLVRNANA